MRYNNLLKYPGCKWNKHLSLLTNAELTPYLPQTDMFNRKNFLSYLNKYPVIFLKPRIGGGGYGVFKISKTIRGFILHSSIYQSFYNNKIKLLRDVEAKCAKRKYIIQQGIDLLKVNNRLVDFRLVLLKPYDQWEYIGIMGKSAAKNRFVTNQTRGGKSIRFKQALMSGLNYSEEDSEKMEEKLQTLGLSIADALNKTFMNISELGLDIAIDTRGDIWLLEANTRPHFNLFKAHENENLYNKIMSYTSLLRSSP